LRLEQRHTRIRQNHDTLTLTQETTMYQEDQTTVGKTTRSQLITLLATFMLSCITLWGALRGLQKAWRSRRQ